MTSSRLGGDPQRGHPFALWRLVGEQGGDVASSRGLYKVSGASRQQDLDDVCHPEHRRVPQRGASGNPTGIGRSSGGQVGACLDEDPRDLRVAVAGRSHQRCLGVGGIHRLRTLPPRAALW